MNVLTRDAGTAGFATSGNLVVFMEVTKRKQGDYRFG